MKYTLKHRLIGAAVLASVAVLLLPSFLKEKKDVHVSTKSQIPASPAVLAESFKAPQPVLDVESAPAPETMFVPAAPVTDSQPPAETVSAPTSSSSVSSSVFASSKAASSLGANVSTHPLDPQGLPNAWVVQVGSFTSKEAANKLRDELQGDGQKAYVRTTVGSGGSISRVYIGPKLDKAQAQQIKDQMDKRLKVKSMLMRFQP